MPGSTPTAVPSVTPSSAKSRYAGCSGDARSPRADEPMSPTEEPAPRRRLPAGQRDARAGPTNTTCTTRPSARPIEARAHQAFPPAPTRRRRTAGPPRAPSRAGRPARCAPRTPRPTLPTVTQSVGASDVDVLACLRARRACRAASRPAPRDPTRTERRPDRVRKDAGPDHVGAQRHVIRRASTIVNTPSATTRARDEDRPPERWEPPSGGLAPGRRSSRAQPGRGP